jgi:hypothetical protein
VPEAQGEARNPLLQSAFFERSARAVAFDARRRQMSVAAACNNFTLSVIHAPK